MTDREAMKMALEALGEIHVGNMTPMAEENWNKALTALRQALAQPEIPMSPEHLPQYIATNNIKPTTEGGGGGGGTQPAQEPVKCTCGYAIGHPLVSKCICSPPKPWVGLTDEEVSSIENAGVWGEKDIRAIEAKLKEKNDAP